MGKTTIAIVQQRKKTKPTLYVHESICTVYVHPFRCKYTSKPQHCYKIVGQERIS